MAERIVFGDENAFHAVTPNSYGSVFSRISITVLRCVVSGCQEFVLRTSTHSNPPVVHTGSARAKGRRAEKFSFIDAWFTEFATPRKQKFYSHWKKEFVTFQREKTAERSAETRNSSDAPVDARLLNFFNFQRDAVPAVYNVNREAGYWNLGGKRERACAVGYALRSQLMLTDFTK